MSFPPHLPSCITVGWNDTRKSRCNPFARCNPLSPTLRTRPLPHRDCLNRIIGVRVVHGRDVRDFPRIIPTIRRVRIESLALYRDPCEKITEWNGDAGSCQSFFASISTAVTRRYEPQQQAMSNFGVPSPAYWIGGSGTYSWTWGVDFVASGFFVVSKGSPPGMVVERTDILCATIWFDDLRAYSLFTCTRVEKALGKFLGLQHTGRVGSVGFGKEWLVNVKVAGVSSGLRLWRGDWLLRNSRSMKVWCGKRLNQWTREGGRLRCISPRPLLRENRLFDLLTDARISGKW